jgi:threonine dehydrogenase-like Zn-dependent dehydrogenase
MRALTYAGPDQVEWREAPDAEVQGDREAVVRPLAVATCDLDALIVAGQSPFPPPFAIGHECTAEVVEVGDAVGSVRPGDRVSVPFQISCGECDPCKRGRSGNCRGVKWQSTYGFGVAVDEYGGFLSDRVRVPFADHMLVPLPGVLDPVAVASASDNVVDGWRTVGPPLEREPGAPVLVVGGAGPGSIGLYAAACAVALGAERVLYIDRDERRLGLARAVGAEAESHDPLPERLGPFPITVDSSADPAGLALALRSTAPDGTCTSTGIYFGEGPSLPLFEMYVKNMTFHTGRVHAREAIPGVLDLEDSGRAAFERVTTRVVPWADAADALVERDWVKLVLTP